MKYGILWVGIHIALLSECMDKPAHRDNTSKTITECLGLYHLAMAAQERFHQDSHMSAESVEQAFVRALKCFLSIKTKHDPEVIEKQKQLKQGLLKIIALHKIENPTFQINPEITKLLHRASLLLYLQEYDSSNQKDRPLGSFSSYYFQTKQSLEQLHELCNMVIKNARIDEFPRATTAYFKGTYHHIQALKLELAQPDACVLIEQMYITAFNSMLAAWEQGDENAPDELEFIFERIQELRKKIYEKNSIGYEIPKEYIDVCNAIKRVREKKVTS